MVVIYTKNLDEFADNNDIVRQLAQGLRRRVSIRPDPSLLADEKEAEAKIREIIPDDAQVTDIYFEQDISTTAAITAIRSAQWHELLTEKGETATTAIASFGVYFNLINEFHSGWFWVKRKR